MIVTVAEVPLMGAPEILIKKKRYFKKSAEKKMCGSAGEGLWKRGGHALRQEDGSVGAVVVLCACWSVCTGS